MGNLLMSHYVQEKLGQINRFIVTPILLPMIERNLVPDFLLRFGIRREIDMGITDIKKLTSVQKIETVQAFITQVKTLPIAINQSNANEQHYEIPDAFYQLVLGPYMKYSSGYWPSKDTTLPESEVAMLELYCERAELKDGMELVDLGCGWGSVTLFMAKKYPNSRVTSISNSNSQREYIMRKAAEGGLKNIKVFTGDIADFDLPTQYYGKADRVISIEMFEHMKNYKLLMKKVSNWLKPGGKLFVHIFSHTEVPSHYENSWMADNFFSGGSLPCDSLLLYFQEDLKIDKHWRVNGSHYQKTLEAWLQVMDKKKKSVLPILSHTYGEKNAMKWFVNWRIFFIASAEFFGARKGEEYLLTHMLFVKP